MEDLNVFIDKEEINKLFNEEKYKNCMDKKYFEYIVSNGKIEYIDKYLKNSKNKQIVESLVLKNKVVKVIDRLSVRVENKRYIGELENLEIYDIEVSKEIVDKYHNQILADGVFSLITLEENIDKKYHYYIEEIEVLEDINVNLDEYRGNFSKRVKGEINIEWHNFVPKVSMDNGISEIDLVLNTIGISTVELTFWEKILFLVRLIPLCEANYNLMELGGNGIGKTKTYSMFSPECEIVQEMLTTELIYNRQSKIPGLLKTKNVIVFDEINKLKLDGDKEKIIPSLLNFMADGKTTAPRKIISKTSLVFSGNVMGIQERIEKNEKNIFDNSHKLEDSAFLDRIHFFLPAWGLRRYSRNIHGLNIAKKIFRFDYFSKALSLLREEDYSVLLDERGYEFRNGSEREILAIRKTISGLIKLTNPDKSIDDFTLDAYIAIAIKGRGLINKFLNNKNKNNINKISVEVIKKISQTLGEDREIVIPVDEALKNLIHRSHYDEVDRFFNIYRNNFHSQFAMSYHDFVNKYNYHSNSYNLYRKDIENSLFYFGKFYPNRQIIVFNNKDNVGEIVFVKFALDKMGIFKNIREEKIIKKYYGDKSKVSLLNNGRILIFEDYGNFNPLTLHYYSSSSSYNSGARLNLLYDNEELSYDELFGGQSLDINDFTGILIESGTRRTEADLSNVYPINKDKKLKCEDGEYIIPNFRHSSILDKYFYEDSNENDPQKKKTSEAMTYVEFKYFLADNGFIELD